MTNAAPLSLAIVDYEMGNLRSVAKALEHLGCIPSVTKDAYAIERADAVILPGVGAFGDAMREMHRAGLVGVVRDRAREAAEGGRPFLGICLGMQVLVNEGEEDPGVPGLGVVPGACPRIVRTDLKVPHMGWNSLVFTQPENPLFAGMASGTYVYFVHSFQVAPDDRSVAAATVDYGGTIVASLRQRNLYATQFHPEKSQLAGLTILRNFLEVAAHPKVACC